MINMKKINKNMSIKLINKDELLPLYNSKSFKKKGKTYKNKYNKIICYFFIFLIILFIILMFFYLFIIKYLINNKEGKLKLSYISNTTILLIGIARLENNYIREWVEFYKKIGITKIILCDNNPIDAEKLSEPIKDYVDSNFVEIDENYKVNLVFNLTVIKSIFKRII